MTNLGRIQAAKLSKTFSRRMSIEEYFRNAKRGLSLFPLKLVGSRAFIILRNGLPSVNNLFSQYSN